MDNGDRINELKLIRALSDFSEVYYNEQRYDSEAEGFGLKDKPIEVPRGEYDLYYVRNNPTIFKELPSPKVWLAYPYDEEAFAQADAVLTTTEAWKTRLSKYNSDPEAEKYFNYWYPSEIVAPKKIINVRQSVGEIFGDKRGSRRCFQLRAKFTNGFIVGYFGRLEDQTFPHRYLKVLSELKSLIPDLVTVFSGKKKHKIPHQDVVYAGVIPYQEMPFAVSACDLVLCNEEDQADWLGSGKILEAMACGTPPVVINHSARREQLGDDYPLFYDTEDQIKEHVLKMYTDKNFYRDVKQYILDRVQMFSREATARYLKTAFGEFLEGGKK